MRLIIFVMTLTLVTWAFAIDGLDREFYDSDFDGNLDYYELDVMIDDAIEEHSRNNPC